MSLVFKKEKYLSAGLNEESSVPALANMGNVQMLTESALDEDDGLFVGYGYIPSIFPYRMQDLYSRKLGEKEYLTSVLENKYLRAEFLPDFGGRLWSLYDKEAGKELLYRNAAIRPCNLAVRNAWLAGGIEYNCGMVGHGPFTCSRMFTARTFLDDGTPVLRMYEFERVRRIVYQMDFFLPETSRVLYARMRIVNPLREVVPMYWWTNIALPEGKERRNVVDAKTAYSNRGFVVCKNPVPEFNGTDITYPTNNETAVDYFWKIPESKRKFTAYLDKDGYGFVQTSTSRLKGRKLFVWGQGPGGERWQEFLTADNLSGKYIEVQAGLANTQYECIPMPPKTAWEWLECYGALNTNPESVHGEWDGAITEVSDKLEELISEKSLEELLVKTHKMALTPADELICNGSGWGKLENMRRNAQGEDIICPHLDFGEITDEQYDWNTLLQTGSFDRTNSDDSAISWMLQPEWTELIEKSSDCHKKFIHLAAIAFAEERLEDSDDYCTKALSFGESSAVYFVMAQVQRLKENSMSAAEYALCAYKLCPEDISLAREMMRLQFYAEQYGTMISVYETAPNNIKNDGRITMYYCFALLRSGDIDKADTVLNDNGGICVDDIREGETGITDLYLEIEEKKAENSGLPFSRSEAKVPRKFDFRMFTKKD